MDGRTALLLGIIACLGAQWTHGFSVFKSPNKKSLFPLLHTVQKRQSGEADSNDTFPFEVPQCMVQMEACLHDPNKFINDWMMDYHTGAPFRTGAARVQVFCRDVARARDCVDEVGYCEHSYVSDFLDTFNGCTAEGQAALIAMSGAVCTGSVDEDPMREQCMQDYYNLTATTTTTEAPYEDYYYNSTSSAQSYEEENCGENLANMNCHVESYRRFCGDEVANFIEIVSRPQLAAFCGDEDQERDEN